MQVTWVVHCKCSSNATTILYLGPRYPRQNFTTSQSVNKTSNINTNQEKHLLALQLSYTSQPCLYLISVVEHSNITSPTFALQIFQSDTRQKVEHTVPALSQPDCSVLRQRRPQPDNDSIWTLTPVHLKKNPRTSCISVRYQ